MMSATSTGAHPPVPSPTDLTRGFWDAAREERLEIQRCSDCAHFNHPPEPQCPACGSLNLSWSQVSGRGRIYGYTIMHVPLVAGFEDVVPYACISVELEEQEGLFLVGNLLGAPPDAAVVGTAVEVVFEEIADGYRLPQFTLAG